MAVQALRRSFGYGIFGTLNVPNEFFLEVQYELEALLLSDLFPAEP